MKGRNLKMAENQIKIEARKSNIQNLNDLKLFLERLVHFPGDTSLDDYDHDMDVYETPEEYEFEGISMVAPDGCTMRMHQNEDGSCQLKFYFCDSYLDHDENFDDINSMVDWIIDYPELLEIRTMIPSNIPTWGFKE